MNNATTTQTANAERFKVVCMECGKTWWVRRFADCCAKCGGADIEVAEDAAARRAREDAVVTEAQRYV